jgi:type IV secretory pathway VirJ component
MLFMGGDKETDTLLPLLDKTRYNVMILPGAHHFDGNYTKLGEIIYQWMK